MINLFSGHNRDNFKRKPTPMEMFLARPEKLTRTVLPTGSVPRDFNSWQTYVRIELLYFEINRTECQKEFLDGFHDNYIKFMTRGQIHRCQSISERVYES